MIYANPRYKEVQGNHTLVISCAYCKTDIAVYQKVGKGGLLRMYVERIVKGSIDLSLEPAALSPVGRRRPGPKRFLSSAAAWNQW